ncbi:SIR2 family protein [Flavilitoribacter nigricans]|nr:SIR2 family protein [Flavilitoribacter nigricans]
MEVTTSVSTFDWEDILDALQEEKCILFLGPGVFRTTDGRMLESQLYEELEVNHPEHPYIRTFYEDDGFFLFREDHFKRKVIRRIRRFFQEPLILADEVLAKIARIPFHIIFTLTPDGLLARTFDQLRLPYQHDFYNKNQKPQEFIQPSAKRPLIYNMLGYIEEYDSLVLTHNDLFDYLNSIFAGKSMQPELRQQLKQAHSYIFLGLQYEKWYLQLLLRVLSLHAPELVRLERYASHPTIKMKQQLKRLFEQEFNIEFVPNNPIGFINELHMHCNAKGLLRILPEVEFSNTNFRDKIRKVRSLIAENKILPAIVSLKEILESHGPKCNHLRDELILQERNFRHLNQKIIGRMASEQDRIELNQVLFALISLISQTENCLGS